MPPGGHRSPRVYGWRAKSSLGPNTRLSGCNNRSTRNSPVSQGHDPPGGVGRNSFRSECLSPLSPASRIFQLVAALEAHHPQRGGRRDSWPSHLSVEPLPEGAEAKRVIQPWVKLGSSSFRWRSSGGRTDSHGAGWSRVKRSIGASSLRSSHWLLSNLTRFNFFREH